MHSTHIYDSYQHVIVKNKTQFFRNVEKHDTDINVNDPGENKFHHLYIRAAQTDNSRIPWDHHAYITPTYCNPPGPPIVR